MRVARAWVVALLAPVVSGRFFEAHEADSIALQEDTAGQEKYLIELAPQKTAWVTEEEKWALRRGGKRFMDITNNPDLGNLNAARTLSRKPRFPKKLQLVDEVKPLLFNLSRDNMHDDMVNLTNFHTRYYKSETGRLAADYLLSLVRTIIKEAGGAEDGATNITAEAFPHRWGQPSLIARIPGKTNSTIVIGAHLDSINLWLPSVLPAPGADDDGSGTVLILEVLRNILRVDGVLQGKMENTLEFHWYSAEEGGLLGSQDVFSSYEKAGKVVKAMLQHDQLADNSNTIQAGEDEYIGVMEDYVDPGLTKFLKMVITEYTDRPYRSTKCGYACSDHASATKAGYPSAAAAESTLEDSSTHTHGVQDTVDRVNFEHLLQITRMTFGFTYELAFTDFAKLEGEDVAEEATVEL